MMTTYEAIEEWLKSLPRRRLRIAVLTSCTNAKQDDPARAEEMYLGQQHVRLMRGVRALREVNGAQVDLSIVSARYGVVLGEDTISPYNETFQGLGARRIRQTAERIAIPQAVRRFALDMLPDFKLILLGDDYLEACAFDFNNPLMVPTPTIVMCSTRQMRKMPNTPNLMALRLGNREARSYGCGTIGLKGELAGRLLTKLARDARARAGVGSSVEGSRPWTTGQNSRS